MTLTIDRAGPSDYGAAVDILIEAFASDPGFLRLIPQPDEGGTKLRQLFELQIDRQYGPAGMVDLARNEQGEILGVALWDGPDDNHDLAEQAKLLPHLVSIFGVSAARLVLGELHSARQHPRFPHWYLYTIAATGAARGQGVGSTSPGPGDRPGIGRRSWAGKNKGASHHRPHQRVWPRHVPRPPLSPPLHHCRDGGGQGPGGGKRAARARDQSSRGGGDLSGGDHHQVGAALPPPGICPPRLHPQRRFPYSGTGHVETAGHAGPVTGS